MKIFMLLLAIGLTNGDKLDRTYLPPPGSKYSGGQSGDLQVPLEYDNAFSTTGRPQETLSPVFSSSTLRPTSPSFQFSFPSSSSAPQNILTSGIPTTTPSYAFTQTTTYSPIDDHNAAANEGQNLVDQNSVPVQVHSLQPGIPQQGGILTASFDQKPGLGYQLGKVKYDQNGNILPHITYNRNGNDIPQNIYDRNGYVDKIGHYVLQKVYDKNINFLPQVTYDGNKYVPQTLFDQNGNVPHAVYYKGGNTLPHTVYDQYGNIATPVTYDRNVVPTSAYDKNGNILPQSINHQNGNFGPEVTFGASGNILPQTINQYKNIVPQIVYDIKGNIAPRVIHDENGNSVQQTNYDQNGKVLLQPTNYGFRTAVSSERPQGESDRNAVILNNENGLTPEGFAYSFDTSNGIHGDESGTAVDGVKAQGSYSYIGDDGKTYSVVYTADENGFLPKGDHLPTPPPIPEAILRVIEDTKRAKDAGVIQDGSYDDDKYGYKNYQGAVDQYQPSNRNKLFGPDEKPIRRPISINDNDNEDKIDYIEEDVNEGGDVLSGNRKTSGLPNRYDKPIQNLHEDYKIIKNSDGSETFVPVIQNYRPLIPTFSRTDHYTSTDEEFQNAGLNIPGNRGSQADGQKYTGKKGTQSPNGDSNFFTVKDGQGFNVEYALEDGKRPSSIYQGYEYLVPVKTVTLGQNDKGGKYNKPKGSTARPIVTQPDDNDSYIQTNNDRRLPSRPISTGLNRGSSKIPNEYKIQSTTRPIVSNTQDYDKQFQEAGISLGTTTLSPEYVTTYRPTSSSEPAFGDKMFPVTIGGRFSSTTPNIFSPSTQGIYSSTTNRPNFNNARGNKGENILVDEFGRPVIQTSGSYTPGQGTKTPTYSVTQRIPTTIDSTVRPVPIQSTIQPGSTVAPGQTFTSQKVKGYRRPGEEILVDGNGRPIITEPGQVDQVTGRPGYTINPEYHITRTSPAYKVNVYGRPVISEQSTGNIPETTPGYQKQRVGEYGRPEGDYGTSDSLEDSRKATTIPAIVQFSNTQAYGNQPNEGEDFRGPKQQQKYDPKTGYYY